jgi:hypothetical protein
MKNLFTFLFLLTLTFSFSQGTTGKTTTDDKYSKAIKAYMNEYLQNKFDTYEEIHSEDAIFDLNGNKADKSTVQKGWSSHHQIYNNINLDWMFVETTVYDEIKITASTVNKFFILCFSYFFQGMFLKSINLIPQFQRHSYDVKYPICQTIVLEKTQITTNTYTP